MQRRVLSGDKSCLWSGGSPGVGEGDTFTKDIYVQLLDRKGRIES